MQIIFTDENVREALEEKYGFLDDYDLKIVKHIDKNLIHTWIAVPKETKDVRP